jgi:uncharacterized protein (DUF2141 family)
MRLIPQALALCLLLPNAAFAGDLALTVDGVQDAKGNVQGALYDSESSFMNVPEAHAKFRVPAAAGQVQYVFHDLKPGKYALAVFHDANTNGQLDKNSYGVPTEGYGFSNDAQGSGGPPKFGQAAFDYDGTNKSITVSLNY